MATTQPTHTTQEWENDGLQSKLIDLLIVNNSSFYQGSKWSTCNFPGTVLGWKQKRSEDSFMLYAATSQKM